VDGEGTDGPEAAWATDVADPDLARESHAGQARAPTAAADEDPTAGSPSGPVCPREGGTAAGVTCGPPTTAVDITRTIVSTAMVNRRARRAIGARGCSRWGSGDSGKELHLEVVIIGGGGGTLAIPLSIRET